MSIESRKPVNYLANKNILSEIHKSKCTYSSFLTPNDSDYDVIVSPTKNTDLTNMKDYITPEVIQAGREKRSSRLSVPLDSISDHDVVVRVMMWDHIPLSVKPPKKTEAKRSAKSLFEFDEDDPLADLEDPTTKSEIDDLFHMRVNFPPFQHFKLQEDGTFKCVGKSHWKNGVEDGEFSVDHGHTTNNLAKMYIMLSEKYSMKYNWRGYCVDTETEALTSRGWVGIDDINESDTILSYNGESLAWSSVKSVYRGDYDGNMFHLTVKGYDTLVTPNHKMVTTRGLVPVDFLTEKDRMILMGEGVKDMKEAVYVDSMVELIGWIVTEGCYDSYDDGSIKNIDVYQNVGPKADRIRNCMNSMGLTFSESIRDKCIRFKIWKKSSDDIFNIIPQKRLTMKFINELTADQRQLLITTMVDGDGWKIGKLMRYTQKCMDHVDTFNALCAISGIRTSTHQRSHTSFGKPVIYNEITLMSEKHNYTMVENVDFHGGKRNGKEFPGRGKLHHPNVPTVPYKGRVWCPETEFGCFVARRNGTVYLTGNTYNDEMRGAGILQLTYVGLRFNEAKSENPFAFFTQICNNSFIRVLNTEKKNQTIRDDILEMAGLNPSYTRQNSGGSSTYEE